MVKLENVKKQYKDFELNCSMEIPEGRITGLIGQNGAGKSTVFKAILGLVRADEGNIRVLGKEPGMLTAEEKVGSGTKAAGYLKNVFDGVDSLGTMGIFGICLVLWFIIVIFSFLISMRVMKTREF